MNKRNKTIGILGGIGPSASADLYLRIIKYSQTKYNAVKDCDYPPIIIMSIAMLGFDETGIVDNDLVKDQLIDAAKKLEIAGADFIIIACNTVHVFYEDIQSSLKIPVLNIVEETKKRIMDLGLKKIGLLSSESTNKLGLYHNNFERNNMEVLSADNEEQKILNKVIENVMGGTQGIEDVKVLNKISVRFIKDGVQAIVVGCTEIPLAIDQSQIDTKIFDTTQILAESAVDLSFKK